MAEPCRIVIQISYRAALSQGLRATSTVNAPQSIANAVGPGSLRRPARTVRRGERRARRMGERCRSGVLGELLRRRFDAAAQRCERFVAELEEGFGILRARGDERVEIAARDLALKLEQLGRALDGRELLGVRGR